MPIILSSVIFFIWSIGIIFLYYTHNSSHLNLISNVNSGMLIVYFLLIFLTYGVYKFFQFRKNPHQTTWNFRDIFLGFFIELIILVGLYGFGVSENPFILGIHIIFSLAYPVFLVFLWKAIGGSIFYKFSDWNELPARFRIPVETTLGLTIFSIIIFAFGIFGIFTKNILIIVLFLLTIISFFGWKKIFSEIKNLKISEKISPLNFKILSAEIIFLVLNLVFVISLLSVLRPFPIGWDDLGVYMNFPKIIATNAEIPREIGMITWQLITATGFVLDKASTAFFVNQIGGILATISIICFLSILLENKKFPNAKNFLFLPIILGIIFYLMPMTIFQQAKDMKLDPALMFVSVNAFMSVFFGISHFWTKKKGYQILFLLAGIFTGLTFTIKFTSLILIISLLGYISYSILGIFGFFGFISIFIAVFTHFDFWSYMFILMPENPIFIVIISGFLGILLLGYCFYKNAQIFLKFLQISGIFLIGILLSTSVWFAKNISEGQNFSVHTLLNGSGENFENGYFSPDFSKIYTPEEKIQKENFNNIAMITESGNSHNEDMARYFGKEGGLNNYIKLPFNLTLQKNQAGEFTDITYIFLAFFPVSLLFLRTKKGKEKHWIFSLFIFLLLAIIAGITVIFPEFWLSIEISKILETISLPFGYIILMGIIFAFLWCCHHFLDQKTEYGKNILAIIFLTALYGFLFWISAFGIVWYGIVLYFFLLVIIGFGLSNLNFETKNPNENSLRKNILHGFFALIGIYIFVSTILHSFNNLQASGYDEYKFMKSGEEISTFLYKGDYFSSLAELNIADKNQLVTETLKDFESAKISHIFQPFFSGEMPKTLEDIHSVFQQKYKLFTQLGEQEKQFENFKNEKKSEILNNAKLSSQEKNKLLNSLEISLQNNLSSFQKNYKKLQEEIILLEPIMTKMYKNILSPEKNMQNTGKIYRIGTFFTYFVNNNRSRFYDDSLINKFEMYFYDENSDITVDRLKKLGFQYMLIDLNAATIDKENSYISAQKSGRKSVTTRYENLLLTVKNPKFSLIDTDNICLKLGIDEYRNGNIQSDTEFLNLVGTNFVSYEEKNGIFIPVFPTTKKENCIQYIENIFKTESETYPYLEPFLSTQNKEEYMYTVQRLIGKNSFFALFKIEN